MYEQIHVDVVTQAKHAVRRVEAVRNGPSVLRGEALGRSALRGRHGVSKVVVASVASVGGLSANHGELELKLDSLQVLSRSEFKSSAKQERAISSLVD